MEQERRQIRLKLQVGLQYITMTSNERHGVSNYWYIDCLLNSLCRLATKKLPNLHITDRLWGKSIWKPLIKEGSIVRKPAPCFCYHLICDTFMSYTSTRDRHAASMTQIAYYASALVKVSYNSLKEIKSPVTGIILCMCQANERRCYNVTPLHLTDAFTLRPSKSLRCPRS